jgi:uncharacterized protein YoxC
VEDIKEKFLELLEKDKEFRYAIAGYLGIAEILRRLDSLEETQTKILEEIKNLREGQNKLWDSQNKLWENQNKMWEEIRKIWEEIKNLTDGQNKLWEEVRGIRLEMKLLREDQEKMRITVERLTLSVEEEAKDVISHRLKKELGIDIS